MSRIKKLSFFFLILIIGDTLHSSEIINPVPESFKQYRLFSMGDHGELYAAPSISFNETNTGFPSSYIRTLSFEYQKVMYSISFSLGASEDPHFVFSFFDNIENRWKEISVINGSRIYLGFNGQIYSEGSINNYFNVRRKFLLKNKTIEEVMQPFLLADIDCKTHGKTHLKTKPDNRRETIAILPDKSSVKILMAQYFSQDYDIHMDKGIWFLVSTPFGLVGWVKTEPGYLSRPGKPLSCIRFFGD